MSKKNLKMPALWSLGDDVTPVAQLLRTGGVLGIPTESSYGLAVDPRSEVGVAAIYALKRRESRKPLPLVVADEQQALALGLRTDSAAFRYGMQFWPAPLTMLVPVADRSLLALGELNLIAVRIPDYKPLLSLLVQLGHGLTATSANLSGKAPLLEVQAVQALLRQGNGMVVDSPPLCGGAPSTVVAWRDDQPVVLRQGRFSIE